MKFHILQFPEGGQMKQMSRNILDLREKNKDTKTLQLILLSERTLQASDNFNKALISFTITNI